MNLYVFFSVPFCRLRQIKNDKFTLRIRVCEVKRVHLPGPRLPTAIDKSAHQELDSDPGPQDGAPFVPSCQIQ